MMKKEAKKKGRPAHGILRKGMALLLCLSMLMSNVNGLSIYAMENTSIQTEDVTESSEEMPTTEEILPSEEETTEQVVSDEETVSDVPVTEELSSEESSEAESEESHEESYEERAYALLAAKGLAEAFDGGSIDSGKFTLDKAGTVEEIPNTWTGLALGSLYDNEGNIRTSLFPIIDGYHMVSATVHDGAIKQLGMLSQTIDGKTETFIYYSTSDELNEESVTVLAENDKITLHYELDEFEITYQLTGDETTASLDEIFGKNRPKKTTDHGFSMDITIPRGYKGFVYINSSNVEPDGNYDSFILGDEPIYKGTSSGAEIDISKFPNFYSRSGHYTIKNVTKKTKCQYYAYKARKFS